MKQEWKDFLTQTNFQTLMTHINLHQREQENLIHYQKYRLEMVSLFIRSMMLFWKITSLSLKFISIIQLIYDNTKPNSISGEVVYINSDINQTPQTIIQLQFIVMSIIPIN